jgi:protein-disulfide isomerase/uncharacterized membrane protein
MKYPATITVALAWLMATVASGVLVYQHILGAALPGCGTNSACAALAAGTFGSIFSIPVSLMGFAYFLSLLIAWPAGNTARGIVTIGAAASLFYLGVMLATAKWCPYCVAVHAANLILTAMVFRTRTTVSSKQDSRSDAPANSEAKPGVTLTPWLRMGVAMLAITLVLTSLDRLHQQSVAADQRAKTKESVDKVIGALNTNDNSLASGRDGDRPTTAGFTGRYGRGADPAAARLVIFQDYQCGDCRKLEAEINQRLTQNSSQSLSLHVSIRQFPLCDDCNPEIHYPWFHPLACRAAYLAEAAAILAGEEGFWIANDWLFEHKAKFTDEELEELAARLKIDVAELIRVSNSEQVRQIVAADVSEGISLGVGTTPFVFLNGVAIEGIAGDAANLNLALDRLAEELNRREAAGKPVPRLAVGSDQRPPEASERIVRLWQESESAKKLPDSRACRVVLGNPAGPHRVILFQEPTFADAPSMWQTLQDLAQRRDDVRIEFFVYPMNPQMNDALAEWQKTLYPHSELATRILVAMQQGSGGADLDPIVEWISRADWSQNEDKIIADLLDDLARSKGPALTSEEIRERIHSEAVTAAINSDLQQAKSAEVSWGPTLMINGKASPSDSVNADTISLILDSIK